MKVERNSGIAVTGNLNGTEYAAGVDDENMPHLISLFTDLYSDPIAAMLREYGTNGRDAHIEAGCPELPIRVTLPNAMTPMLKIADSGTGLDEDDIRKIYSRYGSSTKRQTNEQNGMLGLGCKSALAYSAQFTVESVKNGVRTICSISREEDGVPIFKVVASVPDPDAANGTEVVIPIQRQHHQVVADKAAKIYSYWAEGTILVNGEAPARVDGLWLSDDMLLVKRENYYGRSREVDQIVMGNVAYPADREKFDSELPENYHLVAFVPIGTVEFPPARESLRYTPLTRKTLEGVKTRLDGLVTKAVQKEIDKAKTPGGAIRVMLQWRDLLGNRPADSFTFGGKKMPALIEGKFAINDKGYGKKGKAREADKGINIETLQTALVVTGYGDTHFTPTHRRKLDQWVTNNYANIEGLSGIRSYVMARGDIDTTWLNPDFVVPWEDIKAIKLPVSSPQWRSGRPTGSYDAHVGGKFEHIQADQIDQKKPIFYARSLNRWQAEKYKDAIMRSFPNATFVYLPENRYAKFARNFPMAKSYREGIREAYTKWLKSLSNGVRKALTIEHKSDLDTFKAIDPSKVEDPEIRAACMIARRVDITPATNAQYEFQRVLGGVDITDLLDKSWECPLGKYPLIRYMNRHSDLHFRDEHFYLYLNAAYAALQPGGETAGETLAEAA